MSKILVAGGGPEGRLDDSLREFAHALGREVIAEGHVLLNGCFNELDTLVAEGAKEQIDEKQDRKVSEAIRSWVLAGHKPAHRIGQIQKSKFASWDPGEGALVLPEPIAEADAVILVGGSRGTFRTANLARWVAKPLLPVSNFGGAAGILFDEEYENYLARKPKGVSKDEFGLLNTYEPSDLSSFARDMASLAGRMVAGTSVFVIMSFQKESDDTYGTIERTCKAFGYECNRTDKSNITERIFSKIVQGIHASAFVIADVTHESVNVYYELGYAEALGKEVIVLAKDGTKLPFDTKDLPTLFWPDQTRLESKLRTSIAKLTGRPAADG